MKRVPVLLLLGFLAGCATAAGESVRHVETTRPGVTQRFLLSEPQRPVASVILFAGGHGRLGLQADGGMEWGRTNFLVRSRDLFAAHGFTVAVVDAPSDRQGPDGLHDFRLTPEHAADVGRVIAYLRRRASVPVWLVGTSRGTLSAAAAAIHLGGEGADGIVLTSSLTGKARRRPDSLQDLDLGRIRVPVLIVHHRDDGCRYTPFSGAAALKDRLSGTPETALVAISGGEAEIDAPCRARSRHGFLGRERQVVDAVAAWIKARLP